MALSNKEIAEMSQAISPISFTEYRDYLAQVFDWIKTHRESYSFLHFAEDLGFSHTNVIHLIVRGKRPLSNKGAAKISEALNLTGKMKAYFEALVAQSNCRSPNEKDRLLKQLLEIRENVTNSDSSKFQMEYLSEWFHPVIREMCFLPEFYSDGAWIAGHITPRIRPEQARKSLILLENLGLIIFDKDRDRHFPSRNRETFGEEIDDLAVIRYHHAMIELGKSSITGTDEADRDIGAITFAVDEKLASQIKNEAQKFRKKILALTEVRGNPNRVYQMNIQYFPVTKKI